MMPIGDDNSDRHLTPIVNYSLLVLNILVFLLLQGGGSNVAFTFAFSAVPAEIITGRDAVTPGESYQNPATGEHLDVPGLQPTPVWVYLTLLTSMFMHGGFAHLFGNMLYLWIFGDNIENALGHGRYFFFYIAGGVAAALAHVAWSAFVGANLLVPMLGASGAISGVLAGYLLLFPRRRVRVIMFYTVQEVPALLAIGLWFVLQILGGFGTAGNGGGGVAYSAHIGGFLAGLVLIKMLFRGRSLPQPRPVGIIPREARRGFRPDEWHP